MRWKTTVRSALIDTSTAETVGKVDGIVVDPGTRTIAAFVIDRAPSPLVDFDALESVGKDALMIDGPGALRNPKNERESRALSGELTLIGKTALTDGGRQIGVVADVDFDPGDGSLRTLVLADDEVSAERLRGVGDFAVVVSSGRDSLGGLGEGQLQDLTKAELYEIAKERDLDGRSTMNKAELISALT